MKKVLLVFLIFTLVSCLWGCSYEDQIISSLPDFSESVFYTSGGFQDYTDYGKYSYELITEEELTVSEYFTVMTADDVEDVLSYIDNFEGWVEAVGGELKDNYDFDDNVISEGDFFFIKTKEGEPIGQSTYGKFDNYTLYFFDMESLILFYFHSNI